MKSPHPPEQCFIYDCRSPLAGPGNVVYWALKVVGLDIAWSMLRRLLRLPSGCGGCHARRVTLNTWGEAFAYWLAGWLLYLSPYERPELPEIAEEKTA